MGQNLCCLRPPNTNSDSFKNPKGGLSSENEATMMTLGDHMLKSPALNNYPINGHSKRSAASCGDETDRHRQVLKQPVKKKRVFSGSSPDNLSDDAVFYTPRMSFSSSGKLEKIDELLGEDVDKKKNNINCGVRSILISKKGSCRRVVVEKKVDFMLPAENEPRRDFITFYSTREAFDC